MAETLSNVVIGVDTWTDVNTLSGIPVGTEFQINNIGNSEVKIIESTAQPAASDRRGLLISTVKDNYATATAAAGSLRIWAKSASKIRGLLSVQIL